MLIPLVIILLCIILIAIFFAKTFKSGQVNDDLIKLLTIRDFFNVNPNEIFKNDPHCYSVEKTGDNTDDVREKYFLNLVTPEFGVFDSISIYYFRASNSYNLILENHNCEFPRQLIEFINFIAQKYGADNCGNGIITNQELHAINAGRYFSRFWHDIPNMPEIMVDYNLTESNSLNLSLVGLANQSEIPPKPHLKS
jgi:hypothetical protein